MQSTRYSSHILVKRHFLDRFSKKYSNIKFHENQPNGSRAVPCGQTDMTNLIVAFRNFANSPNNGRLFYSHLQYRI